LFFFFKKEKKRKEKKRKKERKKDLDRQTSEDCKSTKAIGNVEHREIYFYFLNCSIKWCFVCPLYKGR
jgi:hypothetical protein